MKKTILVVLKEKKIPKAVLVLVILVAMFTLNCLQANGEAGGAYKIEEEVGMHIEIPAGWIVFTKNTPAEDMDVKKYGTYEALMSDMENDGISLFAYHRSKGLILVKVVADCEEFKKIDNLTEVYLRMSDKAKATLEEEIKKEATMEEGKVLGVYFSDETNKKNNYVYINMEYVVGDKKMLTYATVINKKLVTIAHYPVSGNEANEEEKTTLLEILSTVYFDNWQTVEEVKQSIEQEKIINAQRVKIAVVTGMLFSILVLLQYKESRRK
jgi:hypothetical protein